MKKQKTYRFNQLDQKAQNKAVLDYLDGWLLSHPDEHLPLTVVLDLLEDRENDRYLVDGRFLREVLLESIK